MRASFLVLLLGLPGLNWAAADEPVEELPPPRPEGPREKSVLVDPAPAPSRTATTEGWGLIGPVGRHYCIGTTAIADYVRGGQRHIVALDVEQPASDSSPDEYFLYFREAGTGHRWAIARYASADQRYRVYFQAAGRRGEWLLFQRAEVTWEARHDEVPTAVWTWPEPTCGLAVPPDPQFAVP